MSELYRVSLGLVLVSLGMIVCIICICKEIYDKRTKNVELKNKDIKPQSISDFESDCISCTVPEFHYRGETITPQTKQKKMILRKIKDKSKDTNNYVICQFDLEGKLVIIHSSISQAVKGNERIYKNNLDGSTISKCCHGKRKTHGGYKWDFRLKELIDDK